MSIFGWHPRSHRAALEGMRRLTLEERGAYNTLLDLIYDRSGPIPDDPRWLSGWMGCSLRKWNAIREMLIEQGKIYAVMIKTEPCLMNQRAAVEIENQSKFARNLSESGAKGGRKRAENATALNENNDLGQAPLQASLKLSTRTSTVREEANASLSPSADAPKATYPPLFELAWKAYPHTKGRSSKPKTLAAWRRLPQSERDCLPQAAAKYKREGREPRSDFGAKGMHLWLGMHLHADWIAAAPSQAETDDDPAVYAAHVRHFRQTGEWKSNWGELPAPEIRLIHPTQTKER